MKEYSYIVKIFCKTTLHKFQYYHIIDVLDHLGK